jgi:UDP-glucose 4-epimerase
LTDVLVEVNGGGTFRVLPFPAERKPIDIGDYYADYRRIATTLGWQPRTPLREGLARTIRYYREYLAHYS